LVIGAIIGLGVTYAVFAVVSTIVLAIASLFQTQDDSPHLAPELEDGPEEAPQAHRDVAQPKPTRNIPNVQIKGYENTVVKGVLTTNDVFDGIITTLIDMEPFTNVVIMSDLLPYDPIEIGHYNFTKSPFTNELFSQGPPFPYNFVKHTTFLRVATAENLMDLFTCPVKNEIMTKPVAAHVIYTNARNQKIPFVLVCDKSALDADALPEHIELTLNANGRPRRVDYQPLQAALTNKKLIEALVNQTPPPVPETNLAQGWEYALFGGRPPAKPQAYKDTGGHYSQGASTLFRGSATNTNGAAAHDTNSPHGFGYPPGSHW
jgi:hypothetical protein